MDYQGKQVRNAEFNGNIFFCGKDVCDILGYENHNKAIKDHCNFKGVTKRSPLDPNDTLFPDTDNSRPYVYFDEFMSPSVAYVPTQTAGGIQQTLYISEPNLYRLICCSNLPGARKFERWVFNDVLPSIRKTGSYGANSAEFQGLKTIVDGLIKSQNQTNELLQSLIPNLQPTRLETIRAKQQCREIRKKRTVYKYGYSKVCRVLNDDLPRIKRMVREYGEQGYDYYACDVISIALDALEAQQGK
jgi:prophage antirepressor-like protein